MTLVVGPSDEHRLERRGFDHAHLARDDNAVASKTDRTQQLPHSRGIRQPKL